MTPDQLSDRLVEVVLGLVGDGTIALPGSVPECVGVERPQSREHGDYASNVALQLAGRAGIRPRELAGLLAVRLRQRDGVATVDVAGPGFLNVTIGTAAQGEVAQRVVAAGPSYGRNREVLGTRDVPEELVDRIGLDAATYVLARYSPDSTIDINLELWTRASSDNPVYAVQYAHARAASVLRNAADVDLVAADHPSLLSHEREKDLLLALADFPRVVATAVRLREPHRVARYLENTASAFHRFHDACRVLPRGDEEPSAVHAARLLLVDATRVVLGNGLDLLGVSAPERM